MGILRETLAERILREREVIWKEHRLWEPIWQEISELVYPRRGNVASNIISGEQRTRRLFDSTAVVAATRLAAAIAGTVTPSTTQWFDFDLPQSSAAMIPKVVVDYAQGTATALFDILQRTNFSVELQEVYHDLVTFGTAAVFITESDGLPSFRALHPSEYAIWTDSGGRVTKLVRDIRMTIREAMVEFGVENLAPDMIRVISENGDVDQHFIFTQWVAQRNDEPLGFPVDNFPIASIYVDATHHHVVKKSGFYEWPCPVVRWAATSGESYGRSPAFDALPDVASLNKAEEFGLRAWALAVMPPLLAVNDGVLGKPDLRPARMTFVHSDKSLMWFPPNTKLDVETVKRDDKRRAIWNTFFMDQVQFVPERGKTPPSAEEVRARLNIMLQILGPTLSRTDYELHLPLLGRAYGIASRSGRLPAPGPAVISAAARVGNELQVQFVGPIARAKRQAESQKLDNALNSIAIATQVDPQTMDVVNLDEWVRTKLDIEMIPRNLLRTRKEVADLRKVRAEQAAQQRQMEMMQGMAQAGGAIAPLVKEANAERG